MIIDSRLDNDFYQFTMGQVIHDKYPDVIVRCELVNRSQAFPLSHYLNLDRLGDELKNLQQLSLGHDEIEYLRSTSLFSEKYLEYLQVQKLPDVEIGSEGDHVSIVVEGNWADVVFYETPLLAIVTELYNREYASQSQRWRIQIYEEGLRRLMGKMGALPRDAKVMEFGTRRRFSRVWQEIVMDVFLNDFPTPFVGTSNVDLARKFGIKALGTIAHQMFMVVAAKRLRYDEGEGVLVDAQNEVLDNWERQYPYDVRTLLTDTFGTEFFLRHLEPDRMQRWSGFRQDSGDPSAVATLIEQWLAAQNMKASDFSMVFSDGLDAEAIFRIQQEWGHRFKVGFGWGTNLTNDVGAKVLSLVFKPVQVLIDGQWMSTVKLSDNLAKGMGEDQTYYRQLVDYQSTYNVGP